MGAGRGDVQGQHGRRNETPLSDLTADTRSIPRAGMLGRGRTWVAKRVRSSRRSSAGQSLPSDRGSNAPGPRCLSLGLRLPIHPPVSVVRSVNGGPAVSGSVLERLQRLPRLAVLLLGLALIAAIAWLDTATGPKVLLNVFYLLPVMLVAWATASTGYGLLAVLATFLVGPFEAYVNGCASTRCPWRRGTPACARRSSASSCCCSPRCAGSSHGCGSSRSPTSSPAWPTGAPSADVAGREIERSRRYAHELSLAYLDIDGFKAANDRHGHAVGDRVLIALAGVARATARSVDTVARIGGDEFVILMPETDELAALPLADRLREVCSRAAGVGAAPITCSVGLVTYEQPPNGVEELLTSADALMYEAKAAGGDDVRQASVGAAAVPLQ